jgi:hypothetical protein
MLRDVPNPPDKHVKWRFRHTLDENSTRQLIVGAATRFSRNIHGAFSVYMQLRHHEAPSRAGTAEGSTTLGVLLTPRYDGVRPWDTSTVWAHGVNCPRKNCGSTAKPRAVPPAVRNRPGHEAQEGSGDPTAVSCGGRP